MRTPSGRRERKKQQTREAIAAAAFELFTRDGFDRVTVAGVARRAGVAEATVFNYFRTKEDLLFDGLEAFGEALAAAVRDRPAGRSTVAAFAGFLLAGSGLLGSPEPADAARLVAVNRLIADSPALRARERQVYDDHTRRLAAVLADEARAEPDDPRPWVAAHALIGVHRALVDHVRAEVLAGRGGAALVDRVRARADRAFAMLDAGLASYPI